MVGFEILSSGLQSCNLHDHLPVGNESDNGDLLGAVLDITDQQEFDQNTFSSQGRIGLPARSSSEPKGRGSWEKVSIHELTDSLLIVES